MCVFMSPPDRGPWPPRHPSLPSEGATPGVCSTPLLGPKEAPRRPAQGALGLCTGMFLKLPLAHLLPETRPLRCLGGFKGVIAGCALRHFRQGVSPFEQNWEVPEPGVPPPSWWLCCGIPVTRQTYFHIQDSTGSWPGHMPPLRDVV